MLIPHGTLVAVVDGKTLQLYQNGGSETQLKLHALETPKLDAHSKDSGKRHRKSTANPDHHLVEEDAFAAAVADWLNHQAMESRLDHLVVVAAPRALGELRRHYHVSLKERLVGELAKEMTREPLAAVENELKLAKLA